MNPTSGLKAVLFTVLMIAFGAANATVITFSEPIAQGPGFNGQTNDQATSVDGQYLVEWFWLGNTGHEHVFGSGTEQNHNQFGATGGAINQLQGIRISRLDAMAFDLISMDLIGGEAAVGQLANLSTGAGTWTLFNTLGTINFGNAFSNVSAIYIADPGIAGGQSGTNIWDNITLQKAVPEPATLALIALGLVGIGANAKRSQRRK